MKKICLNILIALITLVIMCFLSYIFLIFVAKDIPMEWCSKFNAKNNLSRATMYPECNYTFSRIQNRTVSNEYYCFSSDRDIGFERNTLTPFLEVAEDKSYLNTNFSRNTTKFRIIILGDSVSEGCTPVGQNDSISPKNAYYNLLKLKFNNSNVEILNAAHGCYYIGNYYGQLKKIIREYKIDLVILGITENDLSPCWEYIILDKYFNKITNITNQNIQLTREELNNICLAERTPNFLKLSHYDHAKLSRNKIYRKAAFFNSELFFEWKFNRFSSYDNKGYKTYINGIYQILNEANIKHLTVIFPTNPSNNMVIDEIKKYSPDAFSIKSESKDYIKYVKDGVHPNETGHQVIADILYPKIAEKIKDNN